MMKNTFNPPFTSVMYHYVKNYATTPYPEIKGLDVQDFEQQIMFLKKFYNIVSMDNVIAYFKNECALPPKALLLTFDDGYTDHVDFVLPVLKKYQVQGSFFIPVQTQKEHKVLDVNKIHILLAVRSDKKLLLQDILNNLAKLRKNDPSILTEQEFVDQAKGRGNRYDSTEVLLIKQILQRLVSRPVAHVVLDQLIMQTLGKTEADLHREIYMSNVQLRHLLQEGMHIGAHGYKHLWLDSVNSDELASELDHCVQFLKDLKISDSEMTFCYPYGGYNQAVLQSLEKSPFQLALATDVNLAYGHQRYKVPRLDTNDFPRSHQACPNKWYFEA